MDKATKSAPSLMSDPSVRAKFDAVAEERYAEVIASGITISWDDMRAYLEARVAGNTATRPIARKICRAGHL